MKKTGRLKRLFSVVLAVLLFGGVPFAAAAEEMQTVQVSVQGTYAPGEADAVLERINAIREEEQGESYVPLEWSGDLEQIARLRAAEASVSFGDVRPNGKAWSTVVQGGVSSSMENLAQTTENAEQKQSAMLAAVEQWYAEKDAYTQDSESKDAVRYAALVDPAYRFIGLAAFQKDGQTGAVTAAEFSAKEGLKTDAAAESKETAATVEVSAESLRLSIAPGNPTARRSKREKHARFRSRPPLFSARSRRPAHWYRRSYGNRRMRVSHWSTKTAR